ncbi:MAG: hypothetical protein HY435_02655 [Candidatus Liptonbacteria bacterium]|nr:hypothetical protein [Candidatus Liptonbacteria bacterium]
MTKKEAVKKIMEGTSRQVKLPPVRPHGIPLTKEIALAAAASRRRNGNPLKR